MRHNHNLEVLLEESPESYYWTGFILADGSVSKEGLISISLSKKDEDFLNNFSNFVNARKCYDLKDYQNIFSAGAVRISVYNNQIVTKFIEKFDIDQNKTYRPPNLSWINDKNLFISLFAGYCDGDGSMQYSESKITKTGASAIRFHVHASWFPFFIWMNDCFLRYYNKKAGKPKIGKDGYLRWDIIDFSLIKQIKKDLKELKLPIMDRKWSLVKDDYLTKNEIRDLDLLKIIPNIDKKYEEISEITGIGHSRVTRLIKYYNETNNIDKKSDRLNLVLKIVELKNSGMYYKDIAKLLNIDNPENIHKIIRRYNESKIKVIEQ